jgi:hypothetical protein
MILGYFVAVHGDVKGGPPFYTAYLEVLRGEQVAGHRLFPVAAQDYQPSPVSSHSSSRTSQARKDRKENNEYLKQISDMAKIVQQQRMENKKLEKLFSDAKKKSLQLSEALSQQQENTPAYPWDKFVTSEVTGSYYAVTQGRRFDSSGIYADVNKFLLEVNGVVGSLFKVCDSYSKAHLYLKERFVKEHPAPSNVAATDSPPSFTKVASLSPSAPPQGEREAIYSRLACWT